MPNFTGTAGSDAFLFTQTPVAGEIYDGGAGIDTITVANGVFNTSFLSTSLLNF